MEDDPALPTALRTILGSRPTRPAVHCVVDRCHRMACAYLRQQQQTGAFREDLLGEDVEGLAMDAIAELFERDDRGRFPELRCYFSDRSLDEKSAAAVEEMLRPLVLGAVTDWLFEAYETADRSLANLLRNLKRVLDRRPDVRLHRQGDALWVDVRPGADEERSEAQRSDRSMPMDVLEAHLTGAVAETVSTGELAEAAIETLRAHPSYRSAYPLTRLAQVMRAARVRVQAVTEHQGAVSVPEAPLLRQDEIEQVIEQSLAALRDEKRSTYIDTGKVSEQTYEAYFQALYDRLDARFVPPESDELSHYDALSTHLSDLSREQYREQHRSRLEYLGQCAHTMFTERLRTILEEDSVN